MRVVANLKGCAASVLASAKTIEDRLPELEPKVAEVVIRRCANILDQLKAVDAYLASTVVRTGD